MDAVRVTIVRNELEAEVVCGLLRENGIRCGHRRTDLAAAAWDGISQAGPTEILVGGADLEAARSVLVELDS